MKAQLKIMIIMVAAAGITAQASELGQKSHLNFDFNRKIGTNNEERAELQKSVTGKMAVETEDEVVADQQRVMNLIEKENLGTSELQIGSKERPVNVDRRFNSIGEPVVDYRLSEPSVQLVEESQPATTAQQASEEAQGSGT